jgi:hypothetical protein
MQNAPPELAPQMIRLSTRLEGKLRNERARAARVRANPVVEMVYNVSRHWALNGLVMATIIVCALCDGLTTYPQFEDSETLMIIDAVALCIFILEMLLKILGHGYAPWRYFIGLEYLRWRELKAIVHHKSRRHERDDYNGEDDFEDDGHDSHVPKKGTKDSHTEEEFLWNCFDFSIVAVCFVQIMGVGGNMSSLRLLRVLRVTRLLNQITALRAIMSGLFAGMKASSAILGLSGFVFFLFANVGVEELEANDPLHFLNMKHAIWTLYRLMTMDWLTVCYTAIYGCEVYRGAGYTVFVNTTDPASTALLKELRSVSNYFASYEIVNKEQYAYSTYHDAVLPSDRAKVPNVEQQMIPSEMWCDHRPNLHVGVIFFMAFTLVSGMIIVTLFTGAVSMSMTADMNTILEEDKARRLQEEEDELFGGANASPVQKARQRRIDKAFLNRNDDDRSIIGLGNSQQKSFMRGQIYVHWVRMHLDQNFATLNVGTGKVRKYLKQSIHMRYSWGLLCASQMSTWRKLKMLFAELSLCCWEVSTSGWFKLLINSCIILSAGVSTARAIDRAMDFELLSVWLLLLLRIVFSFEFIVKLIAEGADPVCKARAAVSHPPVSPPHHPLITPSPPPRFSPTPNSHLQLNYWDDAWNIFDTIILAATLQPSTNPVFGTIRSLRMLKLLQEINHRTAPQLSKITGAFAAAISSLKYVGALWFIIAYVYAIVGVSQFRGNDPVHFNTLHNAMFTLFGAATFDSLTDLVSATPLAHPTSAGRSFLFLVLLLVDLLLLLPPEAH